MPDLQLLDSVIQYLKNYSANITVVESDNRSGTADRRAAQSGLLNMLKSIRVPFRNLSLEEEITSFAYHTGSFSIPRIVTEADRVINICKLKTCFGTTVSLSLKNLFGLICERSKPRMHRFLDEILVKVNGAIERQLIVVDGIVGMEGNGPVLGSPVHLGILVSGTKPGSVDAVCSRLMGFDPTKISHIKKACEAGLGQLKTEDIEVLGEPLKTMREFKAPSLSPTSVLGTLKSAVKVYSPI